MSRIVEARFPIALAVLSKVEATPPGDVSQSDRAVEELAFTPNQKARCHPWATAKPRSLP
jgi:hypothetical protein